MFQRERAAVAVAAGAVAVLVAGCGGPAEAGSGKPAAATVAPPPAAPARMPDVVGQDFSAAGTAVRAATAGGPVTASSAYADVTLPPEHGTWLVCFQRPAADEAVTAGAAAELALVAPGAGCPARQGALSQPTATPTPTPTPDRVPAPVPAKPSVKPPVQPTAKPPVRPPARPSTEPPAGGAEYYRTCADARAAGAAPIRRGEPGYGRHLDRDNDGIACDS
ncbi:excalibur calcium-binding domain-containing protein [Streptomyces sp. NPDC012888]|uniref:excalibur calcium-binding domain-containing protein n=1 Tax=Streptomyces sp. NPDC012888 TaxID=3364855 RepID=UPI003686BCA7